MPISNPPILKAPAPTKIFFDPFNSSSTGHQRAENRLSGSTSWRECRTYKLTSQLKEASGRGGAVHLSDLVGAGSAEFGKDKRKENVDWEINAPKLKEGGCQDIRDMMRSRKRHADEEERPKHVLKKAKSDPLPLKVSLKQREDSNAMDHAFFKENETSQAGKKEHDVNAICPPPPPPPPPPRPTPPNEPETKPPQIFAHLTIYVNGSTAPLVSDHKLKNLFASHGGNICLGLARRTVTHVILGETGLAAGKIQKEIQKVRGRGVKFVTAAWVVDSVNAGRRKPETEYVPQDLAIGGARQVGVREMFAKSK